MDPLVVSFSLSFPLLIGAVCFVLQSFYAFALSLLYSFVIVSSVVKRNDHRGGSKKLTLLSALAFSVSPRRPSLLGTHTDTAIIAPVALGPQCE